MRAGDEQGGAALLEEALALWRARRCRGWAGAGPEELRTTMREAHQAALVAWAQAALRSGRAEEVADAMAAAGPEYPLNEAVCLQRMRALQQCGRPSDALTVFERFRRRLATDTGADPGPQVARGHQDILRAGTAHGNPREHVGYPAAHVTETPARPGSVWLCDQAEEPARSIADMALRGREPTGWCTRQRCSFGVESVRGPHMSDGGQFEGLHEHLAEHLGELKHAWSTKPESEPREFDLACYGMDHPPIRTVVTNGLRFHPFTWELPGEIACSLWSEQEHVARHLTENVAKIACDHRRGPEYGQVISNDEPIINGTDIRGVLADVNPFCGDPFNLFPRNTAPKLQIVTLIPITGAEIEFVQGEDGIPDGGYRLREVFERNGTAIWDVTRKSAV